MDYKRPVSALIVIYAQDTRRVLMLQHRNDPYFWQSVTGTAAFRKVKLWRSPRSAK